MIYILERDELDATFHHGKRNYRPGPWWDGGRHRSGTVRTSIWPKIAQRLKDARVDDPEDFVRFVFEKARIPPPVPPAAPMPNHLLSPRHLEEYRRGRADRQSNKVSRLRNDQRSMGNTLRSRLGWYEDYADMVAAGEFDDFDDEPYEPLERSDIVSYALLDQNAEMNALFRFCFAVKCELPKIATIYEKMAAYDYIPARNAYDRVWGTIIPDAFRRKAVALYEAECLALLDGR